jgi:hypothetical protein
MDLQRFHLLCARVRVVILALLGCLLAWVALGLVPVREAGPDASPASSAAPVPTVHDPPGLRAAAG